MRLLIALASFALCAGCATAPKAQNLSVSALTDDDDPDGRRFRVMTFNIQSGRHGLDRIAEIIREQDPEVVALQEVDQDTQRSKGLHQARELARRTGLTHYAYFPATKLHGGNYGVALISKHPIVGQSRYQLPTLGDMERRMLAHAVLDVEGQEISVYVTHLSNLPLWEKVRMNQARLIARVMSRDPRPQLLMGDLNDAPDSATLLYLRKNLTCAFSARGEGPSATYPMPAFLPDLRLDYVLASPQLAPLRSWVVRQKASDHFPVMAEFALARPTLAQNEQPAEARQVAAD